MTEANVPNVINLNSYKKRFFENKFRRNYNRYLKLLKNDELENEVNFLLDEFSGNNFGQEFFLKGEMILGEIAGRVDQPLASSIESMAQIINKAKPNSI